MTLPRREQEEGLPPEIEQAIDKYGRAKWKAGYTLDGSDVAKASEALRDAIRAALRDEGLLWMRLLVAHDTRIAEIIVSQYNALRPSLPSPGRPNKENER